MEPYTLPGAAESSPQPTRGVPRQRGRRAPPRTARLAGILSRRKGRGGGSGYVLCAGNGCVAAEGWQHSYTAVRVPLKIAILGKPAPKCKSFLTPFARSGDLVRRGESPCEAWGNVVKSPEEC